MAQFAHHPLAIPYVPQAGPNEYSMIENQLPHKHTLVCTDLRKVKSNMPYIILLFFNHINIEFNGKGEKHDLLSINTLWNWNKWDMKKWGNITAYERMQIVP
ncbi:MAG: hypothetical protein CMH44_00990 [Muricauda sp.]|nr:hypothetical protein [Allomuricauda sp.]